MHRVVTATEGDRVRFVDEPGRFEVSIRAPHAGRIFLVVLFLAWTFAALSAIAGSSDDSLTTLIVTLGIWLTVSVLIAASWSWAAFGREAIVVHGDFLTTSRGVGRFRLTRSFPLERCSSPQVSGWYGTPFSNTTASWLLLFSGGNIAVVCGDRTVRFGLALGEMEAQIVAGELASRMQSDIEQAYRPERHEVDRGRDAQ